MREKAVKCFSSAADAMKGPPGYMSSAAFRDLRWTAVGDQRVDGAREFCRKLLARLDGMEMPFYPAVGLMDLKTARQRYVTNLDPWEPMESPFLDGIAFELKHCVRPELPGRCWFLLAEVAFDVARLASIPIAWGGFSRFDRPGMFVLAEDLLPEGFWIDGRTYGTRLKTRLEYKALEAP